MLPSETLNTNKVVVALSGGVDSAAAAVLLCRAKMEVTGVYICLQNAYERSHGKACCSPQDAADAGRIASILGINFMVLSANEEFEGIKNEFALSYLNGRTPNPCILCNQRIKFGKLFDLADSIGAHFIATGHYARRLTDTGVPAIHRALALAKDQSYVLFNIQPSRLNRILFPLGDLPGKHMTRGIVRDAGLPVFDKPESQEICFATNDDYRHVLAGRADQALQPGPILDTAGRRLGTHDGYGLFTIGQRRKIKVSAKQPLYVQAINPAQSSITVGTRQELLSMGLKASAANWLARVPDRFRCQVKIRYNDKGIDAVVSRSDNAAFEAIFDAPVHAVTPGQAAVIYDGDKLLGGGWIDNAIKQ